MSTIAELLTEEQRKVLTSLEVDAPAKTPVIETCACPSAEGGFATLPGTTLAVHAPCGRPTKKAAQILGHVYAKHLTAEAVANATQVPLLEIAEPAPVVDLPPVTTINGVEVDLRGDARFQTACADCKTPLEVDVAPEGVDLELLTSKPRVAVCLPCGEKRVQGKQGVVIYTKPETKEEIELDLTKYSKAEFAALAEDARQRAIAEAEAALPGKREAAMAAKVAADAEDRALMEQERAILSKRKVWMGEFLVEKVFVPALDFTEVGLDELVPPKVRSPYNKALHTLGEPILDKETTTYRVLRKVHKRLWKHEAKSAVEMPKGGAHYSDHEVGGNRLLVDLEPDAQAKVEALAKVLNVSLDEAHERLASLSII